MTYPGMLAMSMRKYVSPSSTVWTKRVEIVGSIQAPKRFGAFCDLKRGFTCSFSSGDTPLSTFYAARSISCRLEAGMLADMRRTAGAVRNPGHNQRGDTQDGERRKQRDRHGVAGLG